MKKSNHSEQMRIFGTPLSQQNLAPDQVANVLRSLKLETKITSNNTGFLMKCPNCQQQKLFYSFGGKIFICMDYKECKSRFISFQKLKKAINGQAGRNN